METEGVMMSIGSGARGVEDLAEMWLARFDHSEITDPSI
jgi:hypothetical protein